MSGARVYIDAQVQLRRDIEENWIKADPVLLDGEIAYSKDLERMKVGDGAHKWSELDYIITDGDASSAWFIDKDGNLATDKNVVIRGDMASGAPGQQTTVSVTKIIVNGTTYPATNGAIDISKAFQGLQVDLTPYAKTADIEATYAKKTELEAIQDGVNTSLKNVYSKDETNGLLKKYVLLEATSQTIKGALSIEGNLLVKGEVASSAPGQATTVGVTGIKLNGTTYRDTDSDGVIDLGTIQAGMASVSWDEVQNKPTFAAVATSGKYSDLSGLPTIPSLEGYAKLTNLADYLPLRGGTINGPLTIRNENSYITLSRSTDVNGFLIYGGGSTWRVSDQGWTTDYILIHSGNIGSQSVASAQSLISSAGTVIVSHNASNNYVNVRGIAIGYGGNTIELATSGKLYIQKNVTQPTILNMYGGNVGIGTDSPSYKLDVIGDARIGGNLIVKGDVASGEPGQNTAITITQSMVENALPYTIAKTTDLANYLLKTATATNAFALVSSAGATIVSHNAANNYVNVRGIAIGFGGNTIELATSGKLYIQKNVTQPTILNMYGGSVGIGTEPDSSYKLHVNGIVRCTSVSQSSDIRYKDKIDDVILSLDTMADAPLFIFKWNNNPQDHAIYLGTSAQYWEGHRREVVSGDSFKGLDYSTLGVAGIISLARIMREFDYRLQAIENNKPAA